MNRRSQPPRTRTSTKMTVLGILIGIAVCLAFGVLLYLLNTQKRFD